MPARFVLIVARADVAAFFRGELQALHGGRHGKIAGVPYRRAGDADGTTSHYVAHGRVSDGVWISIVAALSTATQGIRDSVDWQGRPGVSVTNARWAIAYEGADIVAGFRVTSDAGAASAHAALAGLGLTPASPDDAT